VLSELKLPSVNELLWSKRQFMSKKIKDSLLGMSGGKVTMKKDGMHSAVVLG
jgi:hypothetical protein